MNPRREDWQPAGPDLWATAPLRFEHNTCVGAGRGWGYRQRPDPNGRHLMFYDNRSVTEGVVVRCNVFCDAKDSLLRLNGRDWTAALAMDSNCWFQREGPLLLWGRETVGADRFAAFLGGRVRGEQQTVRRLYAAPSVAKRALKECAKRILQGSRYGASMRRVCVTGTNAAWMASTSGARSASVLFTAPSMSAFPSLPWKICFTCFVS
jgi:hypothetical protein